MREKNHEDIMRGDVLVFLSFPRASIKSSLQEDINLFLEFMHEKQNTLGPKNMRFMYQRKAGIRKRTAEIRQLLMDRSLESVEVYVPREYERKITQELKKAFRDLPLRFIMVMFQQERKNAKRRPS